jgi:hypothetical protein
MVKTAKSLIENTPGVRVRVHFENEIEFQFHLGMLRATLLECQGIENDRWTAGFVLFPPFEDEMA